MRYSFSSGTSLTSTHVRSYMLRVERGWYCMVLASVRAIAVSLFGGCSRESGGAAADDKASYAARQDLLPPEKKLSVS